MLVVRGKNQVNFPINFLLGKRIEKTFLDNVITVIFEIVVAIYNEEIILNFKSNIFPKELQAISINRAERNKQKQNYF
jgi:hypothetical protein